MEDTSKKKKSSIIHQINKENKKAYQSRIIERNRIAREKTAKERQESTAAISNQNKIQQPIINDKNNDIEFNEFDNINEDKKVKRVESYDIERDK